MIQMYTARTSEVDEIGEAINEIKQQIDFSALKKYSGGIIFCHMDFVESGVVEALCEELPFDTIGMTSMASADEHGYSLFDLTLTVLTSDEVNFKSGMTSNIQSDNFISEIDGLYRRIRNSVHNEPAMVLALVPYIQDVAGYEVVAALDASCHGAPIWGSITSGIDFNYAAVRTICNGKNLSAGLAMMFLDGPLDPKFVVVSIPERSIANNRAVITKSKGAILYEVNGLPVLEYLATIGLVITRENITTTPLMLYYDSSEVPVALGFYTMFEDGSVLTGGEMPEGSSFAIGSIDAEGIIESANSGLKLVLEHKDRQATLLLPCVTRYIMLAPDQEHELQLIKDTLAKSGAPFAMGYSGGEICPMPGPDGTLHNRFHNYTFSACIL